MPFVSSNGLRLAYERSGSTEGKPIILIHGVGAQLVRWPASLIAGLENAGFDVIRFDNRDIGLSTYLDDKGVPDLAAILAAKAKGEPFTLPYTLSDMAADTAGLMDALGIASAHILGVSLGGMVAQQLAIERSERVRSLTLVMTQSGNPETSVSDPQALAVLASPAPDPRDDLEGHLRHSVHLNRTLGSPGYPTSEEQLRDFARAAAARAHNPAGAARQLAAGRGAPDRRRDLARLNIPALVIHGADDPLIGLVAGEDLARSIPGAWLLTVHGMGHDLPEALADLFVGNIAANTRRAPQPPHRSGDLGQVSI